MEYYPIRCGRVVLMVMYWRWIERTTGKSFCNEHDTVTHAKRMAKELEGLPG